MAHSASETGRPLHPIQPKTVLVYSCEEVIGDGILKLRFAQEIRRRFPDAQVTWMAGLGKTVYAGLFRSIAERYLDEIIEEAGIGDKTRQLFTLWRPMPGRRFDLIIDTQRLVARTLILKRIPHGTFISGTAKFLFSDVKFPANRASSQSFVGSLLDLLDLVSAPLDDEAPPVFELDPAYHDLAAHLLPAGPTYVGIAPGTADRRKLWPLSSFIEIAKAQLEKGRQPVFLLGPDEVDILDELRSAVPEALFPEWDRSDDQKHLKGPLLVMALAARMNASLANNSGTGHMLAVGGAPLVSIFTEHDPDKYGAQARALTIVHARDYGGTDAKLIPVSRVLEEIDSFVGSQSPLRA